MRPSDLLKEISKGDKDKARSFITEKPPHPSELGRNPQRICVTAAATSNYDEIELVRSRAADGTNVIQTTDATGVIIQGPDEFLRTHLGSWNREEFKAKPTPAAEIT